MTNQASEAKLRAEILTEFKQVQKLAPADYTENCTNVVMSIIRTEKLKLLAEVRERVIGENNSEDSKRFDSDTGACDGCDWFIEDGSDVCPCVLKNMLREVQRTALTKLEAEL